MIINDYVIPCSTVRTMFLMDNHKYNCPDYSSPLLCYLSRLTKLTIYWPSLALTIISHCESPWWIVMNYLFIWFTTNHWIICESLTIIKFINGSSTTNQPLPAASHASKPWAAWEAPGNCAAQHVGQCDEALQGPSSTAWVAFTQQYVFINRYR